MANMHVRNCYKIDENGAGFDPFSFLWTYRFALSVSPFGFGYSSVVFSAARYRERCRERIMRIRVYVNECIAERRVSPKSTFVTLYNSYNLYRRSNTAHCVYAYVDGCLSLSVCARLCVYIWEIKLEL